MNASGDVPGWCNESRVTCMKNNAWLLCHKYDVNYMIMQWKYDKSNVCHNNDDHHTSIYLQLMSYNSKLEQDMTLYECLRWCTGMVQ